MSESDCLWQDENGYVQIKFQDGPIPANGVNGTTIEDVIDLLVERLERWQSGPMRCRENALAITNLQDAQNWLYRRTRSRVAKGVEGTELPH